MRNAMRFILMLVMVLGVVSGCGDSTGTPKTNTALPPPVQTYTLSGTVKDIRPGTSVVLQNNGGDDITISAGDTHFSFPAGIAAGGSYNVKWLSQTEQNCRVRNAKGKVSASDIKNLVLECVWVAADSLENTGNSFTALLMNGVFVMPDGVIQNNLADADPSVECMNQIELKNEIRILNMKINLENFSGKPFNIKTNSNRPGKTAQKAIFMWLGELKKCKKSGDEWRSKNYPPPIVSVIDKSYADFFALTINLYASKIRYSNYAQSAVKIHKDFVGDLNTATKQIADQQAEEQRAKELARQQEEEKRLAEKKKSEPVPQPEDEQKRLAEKKRLSELAIKQEEQMVQAEEERVKELELLKQKFIEQEKQFQPLHQRQKFERLK